MIIVKEKPEKWEQKNIKFLFEAREKPVYKIFFLVKEGFYKNMIGFVNKYTIKSNFVPRAQNFFVKDLTNLYKRKFYNLGAILLNSYSVSDNNLYFIFFKGKYKGLKGCITPESFQGEARIKNFLEKNVEFVYQKRFYHEDLSYQIFDFFLPNLNLAIEYNGEQHYIENNFFAASLAEQKRSDKRKELYCKKNNIELLIIPYWEYNKIEEILKGVVSNGLYS